MIEFLAAVTVFALVMAAMAIGLIVSGRKIKRTCGGMNNLKKLLGTTPCDACKDPSPECALRRNGTTD